jgi:hypothetical protein
MYWVERDTPHIKKNYNMNKTFELSQTTLNAWNTARNEKPVYVNFAASKMSQAVKPNSIVMFKDFMGRQHKVICRNKPEIKKAMEFFSILKAESAQIKRIIADYPMSYGQVAKKFIPSVKRELRALGLSPKQIDNILIMYWA